MRDTLPRRHWQAFSSALAIEFLLIAGTVSWVVSHQPPPTQTRVTLTFDAPVTEPPKVEEPPPKQQPPVRNQPAVLPAPAPKALPKVPAPVLAPAPVVQAAAPEVQPTVAAQAAAPTPFTAPISPPPPKIVAPPVMAEVDPMPAYNAKLVVAAQAAFVMPSVAINLGFKGRAQVQFNLRDGVASEVRLARSSGLGAVDRAALSSVELAKFPPPPTALQGKHLSFVIWVEAY